MAHRIEQVGASGSRSGAIWRGAGRRLSAIGALTVFAGACTGNVAPTRKNDANSPVSMLPSPSGTPSAPPTTTTTTGNTTTTPTFPPPVPGAPCAAEADPGRTTLRRLTHDEYDNTVRDLLGDMTRPAQSFPGTDDSDAELLTLSPVLFERYEGSAAKLIDAAWAREEAGQQAADKKLWVCTPSAGDVMCAQNIVRTFAAKAFRRPVSDAELSNYFATAAGADVILGTKNALKALLLSPNFIYRVELDPPGGAVHPLSPHELATRLAYAVWASTPDQHLTELANTGALGSPESVNTEARRLLADPKAEALTSSFGERWLGFSEVEGTLMDTQVFPQATPALLTSMRRESEMFFGSLIADDRSLLDVVSADYTFLDAPLAANYGLPSGPAGTMERVTLPAGSRRGILGHGSFLTATSKPDRTSPVARGKWVTARLMCTTFPPPPPGVDTKGIADPTVAKTERERLAVHRANPTCAGCHNILDPVGLGLENYDALGHFRTEENGAPIDASGTLPSGAPFVGPEDLANQLRADRTFAECVSAQLVRWSLGRAISAPEECVRTEVANALSLPGAKTSDALVTLFQTRAFLNRRGE